MTTIIPTAATARTFADLINEVIAQLQGYVRDQEKSTYLRASCDTDDLILSVPAGVTLSPGIIEVDYELMWVESVDTTNGLLTVAPFGRGQQGTTAASHAENARVVFNPRLPKLRVARAINDTLASMGRDLPALATTTITANAAVITYQMPTGTRQILDCSWQAPGVTEAWVPIRSYQLDSNANTTEFTTGKSVSIFDDVVPGQTIQVVYTKDPTPLSSDDDTFSETGLQATALDCVQYGACYRLVGFSDAGRIDYKSVEADLLDEPNQFGSAQALSRYFFQLHKSRLDEEARRFWDANQPRIRWTR